jgi:hypothetical protein
MICVLNALKVRSTRLYAEDVMRLVERKVRHGGEN